MECRPLPAVFNEPLVHSMHLYFTVYIMPEPGQQLNTPRNGL